MKCYLLYGQCEGKDAAVRRIVVQHDLAAVRADDGAAEGETQAETAFGVSHFPASCVKHCEDPVFFCVRDAGTVVGNIDFGAVPQVLAPDPDRCSRRGVLDRVVDEVDEDLNDQPSVRIDDDRFRGRFENDRIIAASAVYMEKRFGDDIVQQLRFAVKLHAPVLNAADSQKVFHVESS